MKKILLGSLTIFTLSANLFSASTFAVTTNIDILYKESYYDTIKCLNVRNQQSIKDSIQSINKLPKHNIQQEKINKLVTLVNSNKKDHNTVNSIKSEFNHIKTVKYNDAVKNWINNYAKDVEKTIKVKKIWDMPGRNPKNLKGIDVSNWQRNIDFKKVKKHGVQIVYMKATEGCTYTDKYMEQNYRQAKQNGLKVGFYHFFRGKGLEEARYFYNAIKNKSYNCKLALDVESANGMSKEELTNQCLIFMQELKRLSGNDGVVYTYTNFALNNLDYRLSKYSLWIAHYGVQAPSRNNIWREWAGFQYSSKGTVPGVNGNCDLDEFTPDIFVN